MTPGRVGSPVISRSAVGDRRRAGMREGMSRRPHPPRRHTSTAAHHNFVAAAQPNAGNCRRSLRALVARHLLAAGGMDDNAGSLIRTLRQKLGMTQEEFAHEIAVTVSTVNRWENAHAEPSKLAWKAINDLARKRGVAEDIVVRSSALAES